MRRLVIGTRGSALARWQAGHVAERLSRLAPDTEIELRVITTSGDRLRRASLAERGGKGLFLKEIEEALVAGDVDCAVHSLKDVPAEVAPGCRIGAVLERAAAADALCLAADSPLSDHRVDGAGAAVLLRGLPASARVGTSSLRRRTQLLALRRDLRVEPMRGNVDTRLRKLDGGELQAIVVAVAGLQRLGVADRVSARFTDDEMVPAVGQGALAVEVRDGDERMGELVSGLDHRPTRRATRAERAFLRSLGGSCRVPLGARGTVDGDGLRLVGMVGDADGEVVRGEERGGDPEAAGERLAETLRRRGAEELLRRVLHSEAP